MEINIDGKDTIVGRLASYVAKQLLLGKSVNVLNSEKAVISGNPVFVKDRYLYLKNETGQPNKGPFIPRMPDFFVKRIIKRMLPHKKFRGKDAFKRLKCYIGVPDDFKDKNLFVLENANKSKLREIKLVTIQEICRNLGGKI